MVQMGSVQMDVPIALSMATPTAVQIPVPTRDTERYPNDLSVSGSKQSAGMTALMSLDLGKSSALRERALPFRPEKTIPFKSTMAPF
mmetsp:Transcript_3278/g.6136  ORF Transcript_3278/g.6136 Transcript_3278/m.6136 type:complete len:87 (+) Transcript_3278:361-621(+)